MVETNQSIPKGVLFVANAAAKNDRDETAQIIIYNGLNLLRVSRFFILMNKFLAGTYAYGLFSRFIPWKLRFTVFGTLSSGCKSSHRAYVLPYRLGCNTGHDFVPTSRRIPLHLGRSVGA